MNDDLFVPERGTMAPTAKADAIYPSIIQIIEKINLCYSGDPSHREITEFRLFHIQAPEYFEIVILPRLLKIVNNNSPASVNIIKFENEILTRELESGEVDLAICFGPKFHRKTLSHRCQTLAQDELVCVTDKDHPAENGSFTLEEFVNRKHIYPTPWTTNTNMVDGWLLRNGQSRDIIAKANTYYSAIGLIKNTNYVLTLPRRVFDTLATSSHVASAPPIGFPRFTLDMVWTESASRDAGNCWLRDQVLLAAAMLNRESKLSTTSATV
ncbi:DNA-binding transcriptional regulator, LysR family [Pseudomonas marincola]|nr:DNA-binding transcriptional regulator, LysR family [Pseudomonas marincola]